MAFGDGAAGVAAQVGLGDRQVQAQLAGIQVGTGAVQLCGKVDAVAFVAGLPDGKVLLPHTDFSQQFGTQAWHQGMAVVALVDRDLPFALRAEVDVQIQGVAASCEGPVFGQGSQGEGAGIGGLARALADEAGLELQIGRGGHGWQAQQACAERREGQKAQA